jgi:hypothetical protein
VKGPVSEDGCVQEASDRTSGKVVRFEEYSSGLPHTQVFSLPS